MLTTQSYLLLILLTSTSIIKCDVTNEIEVGNFLDEINYKLAVVFNQKTDLAWRNDAYYNGNDTQDNSKPEDEKLSKELVSLTKLINNETKQLDPATIKDEKLREQILHLPKLSYEVLNEKDMIELKNITANMTSTYRTVHLCSYTEPDNCNLTLIPDVQDIIYYSNDIDEIEYYWNEWRTKSSEQSKGNFAKFVKFYRKTAKLNGFAKPSDSWFIRFGKGDEIIQLLDNLMTQLQPLFKQFHARVRGLLRERYGSEIIQKNVPYPQHLSEKYIGAAFRNEENDGIELPYHDAGIPNVTEAFLNQDYLPSTFFDIAEEFYRSIGLKPLNNDYWNESVLPKSDPTETYLYCSNKLYNYYGANLVRMTHCPNIDFLRYANMFESVAAIHFFKESKDQPTLFQIEPFPDFMESFSKIFSLSASTPRFLEKTQILPRNSFDAKQRLNRLYFMGFKDIFLLPVLYVLDKYRVDVLNDGIRTWDNCEYWTLTEKYTGAVPPIKRSSNDFDIPSKLLIGVDDIYSGIIIGTAMKYQVYKYLCEKTGQYEKGNPDLPLDYCDLSNHPEIGENISKAMALGSSKPWTEILATLTDGQSELNLNGFLEYYEPLFEWLKRNNKMHNYEIGWTETDECQK